MAAIDLQNKGVSVDGRIHIAKATVGAVASAPDADVLFDAQETLAVFNVPVGCLVIDAFAHTTVPWTTSVTLDFGDGTDPNGLLATAKVAPTVDQTDGLVKRMTQATAEAFAGGKLYEAADTLDVVIGGATPVAGKTDLYVLFIPVTDDVNL